MLIAWDGDMRQYARLDDRLKPFSTEELSALVFTMDIAATVEPLTPEAAKIQQELIDESEERDSTGSTSKSECQDHGG